MDTLVDEPPMADDDFDAAGGDNGKKVDGSAKGATARKRTKTGCLTCRRRRIKCGEEKPTCGNCIKSKRQCEGYNQRVVFKEPVITWQSSSSTHRLSQLQQVAEGSQHNQQYPHLSNSQPNLPNIRPKPKDSLDDFMIDTIDRSYVSEQGVIPPRKDSTTSVSDTPSREKVLIPTSVKIKDESQPFDQERCLSLSSYQSLYQSDMSLSASDALLQSYKSSQNWPLYLAQHSPSHPEYTAPEKQIGADSVSQLQRGLRCDTKKLVAFSDSASNHPFTQNKTQEEDSEDDPYDVSDDEETTHDSSNDLRVRGQQPCVRAEDWAAMLRLNSQYNGQNQHLRTYHSVVDSYGPNMLTSYRPSLKDSPLNNPISARIFQHFINVLGPTISTHERNPANPSLLSEGHKVPLNQQHLWTYTMPKLAIHNYALLHAMLAVSSYHIAKLQDIPITASLKHYHIAIRRVAKNVSSPTKRVLPTTLGAIMLLGFYELMSAEHQKWSDHLLGATILIGQIDFQKMADYIRLRKIYKRSLHSRSSQLDMSSEDFDDYREDGDHDDYIDPAEEDVDENQIAQITGGQSYYGLGGISFDKENQVRYTKQDVATYETQRDLFWWYCKQDVYQSILSGNRLFMKYQMWRNCLPRAPIGRLHAVYGSHDHVMLLFGRVADFAAKDLKRKRQVMQSNGGHWRPPTEMQMPGQPPPPSKRATQPSSPVSMFPGMMPETGKKASLPRGFSPTREQSPESSDSTESNLDRRFREAEEEWNEIRATFQIVEHAFGPDFQPLGDEHVQPIVSPFGIALQFRTYGVAGIWMNFYMALIACYRAHPNMPPAPLVAAGISARHTEFYANQIGRISAGIVEDASILAEVNTQVGASLIETTIGLFMAAVQYNDASQRQWTVQRLLDITRLTGWQTGSAIAVGVETSWIRAADMGRGAPYTRAAMSRLPNNISGTARQKLDGMLKARARDAGRVAVTKQERVQLVLGILGVEDDFENLELADQ